MKSTGGFSGRAPWGLLLVPVLAAAVATARAEGTLDEVRPLKPGSRVEVEIIAGTVEVSSWDRDEIHIEARMGRGTEKVEIDEHSRGISIEVVLRSGRNVNAEGTDLVLTVPRRVELEVDSISAPIDVDGLEGSLSLESVSGRVRISGGRFHEVDISSVSGSIEADSGTRLGDGSFETVSGSIRLQAELEPDGDYDLETVSGSIDIDVGGLCADFDVETFSGSIDNEVGPEASRASRYVPSQELSFSTCGGGASVSLSSFSGRIRIRK